MANTHDKVSSICKRRVLDPICPQHHFFTPFPSKTSQNVISTVLLPLVHLFASLKLASLVPEAPLGLLFLRSRVPSVLQAQGYPPFSNHLATPWLYTGGVISPFSMHSLL